MFAVLAEPQMFLSAKVSFLKVAGYAVKFQKNASQGSRDIKFPHFPERGTKLPISHFGIKKHAIFVI